jgi:hypothetical protein
MIDTFCELTTAIQKHIHEARLAVERFAESELQAAEHDLKQLVSNTDLISRIKGEAVETPFNLDTLSNAVVQFYHLMYNEAKGIRQGFLSKGHFVPREVFERIMGLSLYDEGLNADYVGHIVPFIRPDGPAVHIIIFYSEDRDNFDTYVKAAEFREVPRYLFEVPYLSDDRKTVERDQMIRQTIDRWSAIVTASIQSEIDHADSIAKNKEALAIDAIIDSIDEVLRNGHCSIDKLFTEVLSSIQKRHINNPPR